MSILQQKVNYGLHLLLGGFLGSEYDVSLATRTSLLITDLTERAGFPSTPPLYQPSLRRAYLPVTRRES